eukprot:scaffold107411_cov60-Phaeocystis_antarctica.AAC.1
MNAARVSSGPLRRLSSHGTGTRSMSPCCVSSERSCSSSHSGAPPLRITKCAATGPPSPAHGLWSQAARSSMRRSIWSETVITPIDSTVAGGGKVEASIASVLRRGAATLQV